MTHQNVPFLNKVAATGLAVSVACMAYAGFLYMFDNDFLAGLVGAIVGGFTLGRMFRTPRQSTSRSSS